jgi:hypothetical protein
MCLYNKLSLPKNNKELDLYKVFEVWKGNGKLCSIYNWDVNDLASRSIYKEKEWVKARSAYGDERNPPEIVGFHAFVNKDAAQRWGRMHTSGVSGALFGNRWIVKKVTFRNILAIGAADTGVNEGNPAFYDTAYTAMEMYIHPDEEEK